VIVLDVNILLYAYDAVSLEHRKAREWVENVFSSDETIGLPWQNLTAFVRILTHPGLLGERFTMEQALSIVDLWLEIPLVRILIPGEHHWEIFRDMLVNGRARGKVTADAALAALTIEYGGVLYTNDRDFARFPGLRWVDPLA
jgi:uncharacterized protein